MQRCREGLLALLYGKAVSLYTSLPISQAMLDYLGGNAASLV